MRKQNITKNFGEVRLHKKSTENINISPNLKLVGEDYMK